MLNIFDIITKAYSTSICCTFGCVPYITKFYETPPQIFCQVNVILEIPIKPSNKTLKIFLFRSI